MTIKNINARKCPVCDDDIIGRQDKIFCSDQCRYAANQNKKSEAEKIILDINKSQRKNRKILQTLCPEGMATVRKDILTKMGFDAAAFTTIFITTKKQVYYLSYDYGFTPLVEKGIERALIVHKQKYMANIDPWKFVKT